MTLSSFIGGSIWISLLVIIFGVLSHLIDNDLTTWLCFTFLCVVGFLKALIDMSERYGRKK